MFWDDPVARSRFVACEARRALRVVRENLGAVADAAVCGVARTDSPLEAQFAIWFNCARGHQLSLGNLRFAVALRPQVWIECPSGPRYRLDFAVEPLDEWLRFALLQAGHMLKVGVELDGHDYHERTRDQVISRNRRDRDLAAAGWRVLHFSGSELERNPMLAVAEVLEAAADALDAAKAMLGATP
jgi:hypothetical protein